MVLDAKDPLRDIEDANELGREMRRKRLAAVGSRFVVPANLFGLTPKALREEIARYRSDLGEARSGLPKG